MYEYISLFGSKRDTVAVRSIIKMFDRFSFPASYAEAVSPRERHHSSSTSGGAEALSGPILQFASRWTEALAIHAMRALADAARAALDTVAPGSVAGAPKPKAIVRQLVADIGK